jgi:hypothetical protein
MEHNFELLYHTWGAEMTMNPDLDLSADNLAELLKTRVLFPDEFAAIAVGPGTPGWRYLDVPALKDVRVELLLKRLKRRNQVVVGVLAESHDHPLRIILRDSPAPPQLRSKSHPQAHQARR